MAGAAQAYDYNYAHGTEAPRPRRDDRVRVVRSRRPVETVSPQVVMVARVAIAAIVLFAVIAFARIGIHTATLNVMLQNEQISAQIDDVRSQSANLEVQESTLGTPANLKRSAEKLGMSQPEYSETVMLGEDVVATDDSGNLSLSKSLAVAAQE